jgi:hypothetical protein
MVKLRAYVPIFLALALCAAGPASASEQDRLAMFLRGFFGDRDGSDEHQERYTAAFVDLSGHGRSEVIVHLWSGGWCGSGGCTTLVLEDRNGAFRLVSEISISNPPIRVLTTRSHGWRDLGVMVSGGGIRQAYETKLSFDGSTYPTDPTVPPAKPMAVQQGRTVISPKDPVQSVQFNPG